jgi:membrane-bound inhibitor of C-type lysozyme
LLEFFVRRPEDHSLVWNKYEALSDSGFGSVVTYFQEKQGGSEMKMMWRHILISAGVLSCGALAGASDLTIHLNGSQPISRKTVRYQCDTQGAKMGLPAGVFSVEYLNGAGNSLAVVPVGGNSLIFANVVSGSGARYAAQQFIWWDAGGRGTTFSSDSLAGKVSADCHRVQ